MKNRLLVLQLFPIHAVKRYCKLLLTVFSHMTILEPWRVKQP